MAAPCSRCGQEVAFLPRNEGNADGALVCYKRALEICDADKEWPSESLEPIKEAIRQGIRAVSGKT